MASKKMSISIDPEQVMYSQISKSQDGYNSARMVVKSGEKEYMSISYEWEGEGVPDFVMGMMGFMQANEMGSALNKLGDDYAEFATKSKKPPFWKKNDDDDKDKKDDKKKDKKKDDKKKKK